MGLNYIGVVNPAIIELATAFSAKYKDCLQQKPSTWARDICGFTSTPVLRQKFPIDLTVLAGFREWSGPRDIKDGEVASFFIDSKPWERSISVPLDEALSGQFNQYLNKVPHLMRAAEVHPNLLVAALLQAGKTTKGWDGKNLFATDHPVDFRGVASGTWSNLLTAKPFNRTNFELLKKAVRKLKAPDGKTSLGMQVTHVLGDTSLEEEFAKLFRKRTLVNDNLTAADDNIYFGAAQPIVAPELDGEAGVWYVIAQNTEARPVEIQMRDNGAPEITVLGDGTENAVLKNEILFAGKLFGNVGFAIPHCIFRIEPT